MASLDLKKLKNIDPYSLTDKERLKLIEQIKTAIDKHTETGKVLYWKPWRWQREALERLHDPTVMTIVVPAPNKIGKTVFAVCVVYSWLAGYEPWHEVDWRYPGAVKVGKKYFRPSSLGIKPPVDIVMCGEDWENHIGGTLIPLLKEYAPAGEITCSRKNQAGIEAGWTHKNGSTLTFMCYTQETKKFESSKKHGRWFDEPPPRDKREALARSTFVTRGKEGFSATPLYEPWMLDELVLSNNPEIAVMKGLTILDNEDKYDNECYVLRKMGLTDEQMKKYFDLLLYDDPVEKTCVKDRGRRAELFVRKIVPAELQKYIVELDILRMVRDVDPMNAPARLHGTFSSLVGLVYKEYDINKHRIKAMPVKSDWLIIPYIDWHPGTEIAIGFAALTEHGQIFVIDEIWRNMNPYQTAEILINRKIKDGWRINVAIIDSLARGDMGYIRNRQEDGAEPEDTFAIMENKLKQHNIRLITGSKDRNSGIINIQTMLTGPNDIPLLYFFDTLPSYHGDYGHIFEIQRWGRDEKGKIMEKYNHFLVGLGWVTLSGIKWTPEIEINRDDSFISYEGSFMSM